MIDPSVDPEAAARMAKARAFAMSQGFSGPHAAYASASAPARRSGGRHEPGGGGGG